MSQTLQFFSRTQIDTAAWDACVAASAHRIVYGYSWYLDAVLPGPDWKWVSFVVKTQPDRYEAVLPVPLRRKTVLGLPYQWVVHQPLFCQFLGVFSRDPMLDPTPFLREVQQRFRYGSRLNLFQYPHHRLEFELIRQLKTHVLDLSVGYETIHQQYSPDRKRNLRRGHSADWVIVDSADPEPMLTLFRTYHADGIDGGVGAWAYVIFRKLVEALQQRGLATLRYALCHGTIEAGTLFVREGNRIIYLFNAASDVGRRGNARTVLIDQMIRENAGEPLIFDFESPEKPSVKSFYQGFGPQEVSFWTVRWSRLNRAERALVALLLRISDL